MNSSLMKRSNRCLHFKLAENLNLKYKNMKVGSDRFQMKKLLLFFCLFTCSAFATHDKDLYLKHIHSALVAHQKMGGHQLDDTATVLKLCENVYGLEELHPGYIQCVTAQPSLYYAYQIVAEKLLQILHNQKRQDFVWFRSPLDDLITSQEQLFNDFPFLLTFEDAKKQSPELWDRVAELLDTVHYPQWVKESLEKTESDVAPCDFLPEVGTQIISINFSLETYVPADSAMWVFLENAAPKFYAKLDIKPFLRELFNKFLIPQDQYEPILDELITKAPLSPVGIVNQIFIPKELAKEYVYISLPGGFRYRRAFEVSYDEFQTSRLLEDFRTHRNVQGRLLFGCLVNDPKVKIFRHTLISEVEQRAYEQFVADKIEQMLAL